MYADDTDNQASNETSENTCRQQAYQQNILKPTAKNMQKKQQHPARSKQNANVHCR
jgi:hypothetical protein